jgi:hypothetical protein
MCGKAPLFRSEFKKPWRIRREKPLILAQRGGVAAQGVKRPSEKRSFSAHRGAEPDGEEQSRGHEERSRGQACDFCDPQIHFIFDVGEWHKSQAGPFSISYIPVSSADGP